MNFAVDTDTMSSAATKIGLAAEQIDTLLSRLRTDVNEMLGGWSGNGADGHRELHTRYDADVVAINRNLREMQAALQQTHSLYVTQETEQNSDHTVMRNQILA